MNLAVERPSLRLECSESKRCCCVLRLAALDLRPCIAAFTLIELLVVCVIIAVLAGLLLPPPLKSAASAQRIKTACKLRHVGLGAQVYWGAHWRAPLCYP